MRTTLALTLLAACLVIASCEESRRLQYGTNSNARNIPEDLLFTEALYSDSFSASNPISNVWIDTEPELYNTLKLQLTKITAQYLAVPVDDEQAVKTFTAQTWNLVFIVPSDGTNPTNHNIFVWKDVDVASTAGVNMVADIVDYYTLDMYWAVYFAAPTNDILVDLRSDDPSLCGLDNLIVYSGKSDNSGTPEYLDSTYIVWTTYNYDGNKYGYAEYPNVFMLYGTSLGSLVDTSVAGSLVIFFDSIEAWEDDDVVSCSAKGITVDDCEWHDALTDTDSYTVTYYRTARTTSGSSTATVYAPLMRQHVVINMPSASPESTWSIIFPYFGADEYLNPYIGMVEDNKILYLSGRGNGNRFGYGAYDSGNYYLYADADVTTPTYTDYVLTATEVDYIYDEDTANAPDDAVWLTMEDGNLVGDTVDVSWNWVTGTTADYAEDTSSTGYGGLMLCADWNYVGTDFEVSAPSIIGQSETYPNYYGCWDTFMYDDRYCTLCNLDGENDATSVDAPNSMTVTNFVLPDYSGDTFPTDTLMVLYNNMGSARVVVDLNDAGALWEVNALTLVTLDDTLHRNYHSEKLEFSISTVYGIPDNGKIILSLDTSLGGGNEVEISKNTLSTGNYCYVTDASGTSSCYFSWSTSTVTVTVYDDLDAGQVDVELYGLYVTEETALSSADNYAKFTAEVENSSGDTLYETGTDEYFTINYGSGSYSISISDVGVDTDNQGFRTSLYWLLDTDKPLYQPDYIMMSIAGFSQDEDVECSVWTEDWELVTSVTECEVVSLSEIYLEPSIGSNSALSGYTVYVVLSNIIVPSTSSFDDGTITAYIMYNGDVTGEVSETVDLPDTYGGALALVDTEVTITHEYVGVPMELSIYFITPVALNDSTWLHLGFSKNWGNTRYENYLSVRVNDDETVGYPYYDDLKIIGMPSAVKVDGEVTITIKGIDTPNIATGEERTIYIGVHSDGSADWNSLIATSIVTVSGDVGDISTVNWVYPHFKELDEYDARETTDLTFCLEAEEGYLAGVEYHLHLAGYETAIAQIGSVSCSMKDSDGTEYATDCAYEDNVVSYALKNDLTEGEEYTIEIGNIPNPDWNTCCYEVVRIEVWSGDTLMGMSAGALDDSLEIEIELPDYYLNIDGISNRLSYEVYYIGFYSEVLVTVSTGIFVDGFELSLGGEKGFLETAQVPYYNYNGYGLNGYEEATITVGVKDSAYETMGCMVIDCDDDDIYRAPVVHYYLSEYVASLTVNYGASLEVEEGTTSNPIAICTEDVPVSDHKFTIEVTPTDELEDPELVTDVDEIILGANYLCAYIVIDATGDEATVDRTATITISSGDEHYSSYSSTITVVASTNTGLSLTVEPGTPETHTVAFTVTPTRRSLVILYLAPTAHFKIYSDLSVDEANDLLSWVQFLSPESRVLAGVYTDTALEWEADDLLRGVQYKYAAVAQADDGDVAYARGELTMSSGDIASQAVTYNLTIVGNLTDEEYMDVVCDLYDYYEIPAEDIASLDGETCYEPPDYTDEEWLTSLGGGSSSSGGSSGSSSDGSSSSERLRILQSSSSSSSSSSDVDDTVVTVVQYLVLPPIRSWVTDYVTEPDDGLTTYDGLYYYLEDDWEVDDVSDPEYVDIEEPYSVTQGNVQTTTSALTLSNVQLLDALEVQVTGSVCYAIWLGSVEADIVSIRTGSLSGQDALLADCEYLDANALETLTVIANGLDSDTQYSIGLYGRSIDPREYAATTAAITVSARTESPVVPVVEEEEYGLFTSVGVFALLLALFFNF